MSALAKRAAFASAKDRSKRSSFGFFVHGSELTALFGFGHNRPNGAFPEKHIFTSRHPVKYSLPGTALNAKSFGDSRFPLAFGRPFLPVFSGGSS